MGTGNSLVALAALVNGFALGAILPRAGKHEIALQNSMSTRCVTYRGPEPTVGDLETRWETHHHKCTTTSHCTETSTSTPAAVTTTVTTTSTCTETDSTETSIALETTTTTETNTGSTIVTELFTSTATTTSTYTSTVPANSGFIPVKSSAPDSGFDGQGTGAPAPGVATRDDEVFWPELRRVATGILDGVYDNVDDALSHQKAKRDNKEDKVFWPELKRVAESILNGTYNSTDDALSDNVAKRDNKDDEPFWPELRKAAEEILNSTSNSTNYAHNDKMAKRDNKDEDLFQAGLRRFAHDILNSTNSTDDERRFANGILKNINSTDDASNDYKTTPGNENDEDLWPKLRRVIEGILNGTYNSTNDPFNDKVAERNSRDYDFLSPWSDNIFLRPILEEVAEGLLHGTYNTTDEAVHAIMAQQNTEIDEDDEFLKHLQKLVGETLNSTYVTTQDALHKRGLPKNHTHFHLGVLCEEWRPHDGKCETERATITSIVAAPTPTSTVTSTVTSTTTTTPLALVTSTSTATASTLIITTIISPRTTTTTTTEIITPSTVQTVYAACATDNFANKRVSTGKYINGARGSASGSADTYDYNNAADCCAFAFREHGDVFSFWLYVGGFCRVFYSSDGTCNTGQDNTAIQVDATSVTLSYVVGNGNCGKVVALLDT